MMQEVTFSTELLANLRKLLTENKFCDIEVLVGDKLFAGYKCILAAVSQQLLQIIKEAEKQEPENHKNEKLRIRLTGISPVGFEVLNNFLFSNILELNEKNVGDVCMTAMTLGVQSVINLCADFQLRKFKASSVVPPSIKSLSSLTVTESSPQSMVHSETFPNEQYTLPYKDKWEIPISVETNNNQGLQSSKLCNRVQSSCTNLSSSMDGDISPEIAPQSQMQKYFHETTGFPDLLTSPKVIESSSGLHGQFNNKVQHIVEKGCMDDSVKIEPSNNISLKLKRKSQTERQYTKETAADGTLLYICHLCKKKFRTLSYLKNNHIPLHKGCSRFWCKICGQHFASMGGLKGHRRSIHSDFNYDENCTNYYTCNSCPMSFKSLAEYEAHCDSDHEQTDMPLVSEPYSLDPPQ